MAEAKTPEKSTTDAPVVVGIGSSAGGLEAIREFVTSLPIDTGASYVIVQHMSPQHKSLMTSLVASETKLDVFDVKDGQVPEPDTIYVTPPRKDIIIRNGQLRLVPPSEDAGKPKPSVDRFLQSLAEDCGDRSMAIILSGTGSDGAYGVQAIREVGGITIAQDDASAKYDGMSNAAIETGCVDLVLRPSQIGTHLNKILTSPRNLDQFKNNSDVISPLTGILQIVLARTRVDFREYKQTTVQRRIERRITALGIQTVEEYVSYCRNDPREVDALFKDLLISVTRFFRDKAEFSDLKKPIVDLVSARDDQPLRIWVAGCATGEEVYSIAILLSEALGGPAELVRSKTQIFATDIDRAALDYARRGNYSQGALYDVPNDLAEKYFIQKSDGVRVIEALRSVILFSDHNLCQDPPFLNMDLICCRNVMIYFGAKLQSKVLSRLHYAMKPKSYLFLGTAETVGGADQLFTPAGDNSHIFRKRFLKQRDRYDMRTFAPSWPSRPATPLQKAQAGTSDAETSVTERLMFDALVRSLGQNSVLVSKDHSFLRVYGDITPYVNFTEESTLSLQLSLLKSPYMEEARSLVTLALKHGQKRIGARHVENKTDVVRLEAFPVHTDQVDEKMALLTINRWNMEEFEQLHGKSAPPGVGLEMSGEHLRELDKELAQTREALQQTIEELETSNEELQALNEELQSTNEELLATNEELETSNEELQSTNEELITVNEELQVNSSELTALNAELGSVLGNVPIPLVVLDNALQIVRASKAANKLFDIATPLKNPHVSQINLPEGFPRLVEICNQALHFGEAANVDFVSNGQAFTLQCAPFTGESGQMIGATLVFITNPAVTALTNEIDEVLKNAPLHLIRMDDEGVVKRVSDLTAAALGIKRADAIGQTVQKLLRFSSNERAGDDLRAFLGGEARNATIPLRVEQDAPPKWVTVRRYSYSDSDGHENTVMVGIEVTDLIEKERLTKIQNSSLELIQNNAGIGYWRVDLPTNTIHWSDAVYDIHGLTKEEYSPELTSALDFYHPEDKTEMTAMVGAAIREHKDFYKVARVIHKKGHVVWVETRGQVVTDDHGDSVAVIGMFRDVSHEHFTEQRNAQMARIKREMGFAFFSYDVDTQTPYLSNYFAGKLNLDINGLEQRGLLSIFVPDEHEKLQSLIDASIEDGEPFDVETSLIDMDGKTTPCRLNALISQNSAKKTDFVFGSVELLAKHKRKAGKKQSA